MPADIQLRDDVLHLVWPDGHITEVAGTDVRAFMDRPKRNWRPWGADFQPSRTDFV